MVQIHFNTKDGKAGKRIRLTRAEIQNARQQLLSQTKGEAAAKHKVTSTEPKYPKDFWHDGIYCDSYGWAWGLDEHLETVCLGRTENLAASKNDFRGRTKIIVANTHEIVANQNHPSLFIPPSKSIVATFKKDPRFLRLLERPISQGLGIRAIRSELKAKGYEVPLRTLGRWIKQHKEVNYV